MKKYVTLCEGIHVDSEGIHVDSSAYEIKLFEVQGTLCLNTLSVGGAGKKKQNCRISRSTQVHLVSRHFLQLHVISFFNF